LAAFSFLSHQAAKQKLAEVNSQGMWINYSEQVHFEELLQAKKIVIWIDQGTEIEKQIGEFRVTLKKLTMEQWLQDEFSKSDVQRMAIAHQNSAVLQYLAHVHDKKFPQETQEILDMWNKNTSGPQKIYINFDIKQIRDSGAINLYKKY
jgi:hypothetical protein